MRRAVRDLERRMAELDRLDQDFGLGTFPTAAPGRTPGPFQGDFSGRSRRRRRGPRDHGAVLPGLVVTGLVLALVVALSPSESFRAMRRLVGFDNDRLAAAPELGPEGGAYSFVQTQEGSDEPVGYDPCRPIEVLVNPDGAPSNHDELIDTGLARVQAATGLVFERVGSTDEIEAPYGARPRRRPVVIAWATPEQVPGLAGDVAGLAGSVAVGPPGRLRYVTGHVNLDRDLYASFGFFDRDAAQAIIDHELGHLVGLGHVDDHGELMHPKSSARTTFGPGDRAGLARLGNIDC